MRVNPVAFPAILPAEAGDTYTRYGNSTKTEGVGGIQTNPLARPEHGLYRAQLCLFDYGVQCGARSEA